MICDDCFGVLRDTIEISGRYLIGYGKSVVYHKLGKPHGKPLNFRRLFVWLVDDFNKTANTLVNKQFVRWKSKCTYQYIRVIVMRMKPRIDPSEWSAIDPICFRF